ncbi:MAG: cation-translocating P-type ATPase, partial [Simkaniaceae bacterium]|nr:cation-translocating P-type ATPase [Simkaniaceae bacterium]
MGIKQSFKVVGLDCIEEVTILKKVLLKKSGILDLEFDLLNARMIVEMDTDLITSSDVIKSVNGSGMQIVLWEKRHIIEGGSFWQKHGRAVLTVISFCFLVAAVICFYLENRGNNKLFFSTIDDLNYPGYINRIYFLAIITGGWFIVPKALFALRRFQADMNVLMVIAVIGAIAISEWFEAATVTFLFSVAALLEHWSIGRARKAIGSLLTLSPENSNVITSGTQITKKPVADVQLSDHILIKPGEKIPLDARVVKGNSFVNEAPITGESKPVSKQEGDLVYAGA